MASLNQALQNPKMCQYHLMPQKQNIQVAPDEIQVRVTAVDVNAVDFMTSTERPKVLSSPTRLSVVTRSRGGVGTLFSLLPTSCSSLR